jgi:hypothetical protein
MAKVLSYLEYGNKSNKMEYSDEDREYSKLLWDIADSYDMSLLDFYSQPFKPELICEFFEGWKYSEQDINFDFCIDSAKQKILLSICINKYILINTDSGTDYLDNTYLFYPRTLDDFINDANRAGIELVWREVK